MNDGCPDDKSCSQWVRPAISCRIKCEHQCDITLSSIVRWAGSLTGEQDWWKRVSSDWHYMVWWSWCVAPSRTGCIQMDEGTNDDECCSWRIRLLVSCRMEHCRHYDTVDLALADLRISDSHKSSRMSFIGVQNLCSKWAYVALHSLCCCGSGGLQFRPFLLDPS